MSSFPVCRFSIALVTETSRPASHRHLVARRRCAPRTLCYLSISCFFLLLQVVVASGLCVSFLCHLLFGCAPFHLPLSYPSMSTSFATYALSPRRQFLVISRAILRISPVVTSCHVYRPFQKFLGPQPCITCATDFLRCLSPRRACLKPGDRYALSLPSCLQHIFVIRGLMAQYMRALCT